MLLFQGLGMVLEAMDGWLPVLTRVPKPARLVVGALTALDCSFDQSRIPHLSCTHDQLTVSAFPSSCLFTIVAATVDICKVIDMRSRKLRKRAEDWVSDESVDVQVARCAVYVRARMTAGFLAKDVGRRSSSDDGRTP